MIKSTQLFGYEQEPAEERPSEFATLSFGPTGTTYARTVPPARVARAEAMRLKREAPNPRDLALSPLAVTWKASRPGGIEPDALCSLYPRIANRVALCWKDSALTASLLDDLLGDGRGGRKGFPSLVRRELAELRKAAGQNA